MELRTVLQTTPSVREFTDEAVPDGLVHSILDAARFAPNGGNRQAWRVIMLKDPELRANIRDLYVLAWREYMAHVNAGLVAFAPLDAGRYNGPAVDLEQARRTPAPMPFSDQLNEVPVLLLVIAELAELAVLDNGLDRQSIVGGASIYPFVHNVLLAARDAELGGVMTTALCRQEPAVKELLDIPDGFALAALVALGHPTKTVTKLKRKPVEAFTSVDRFAGSPFTDPKADVRPSSTSRVDPAVVRRVHEAIDPLHSFTYFSPEYHERLVAAGLEPGLMPYLAGRSAPMGAVSAGVVAATFYNFNVSLVSQAIPRAWTLVTPAAVIEAKLGAVDQALTRLLGPEVLGSPELARLAELTREATGGCDAAGRPMYAGQAELEWPTEPHLAAWHAISMLREYRGDGHVAALSAAGLSGLEAQITHVATGHGFVASFAKLSRGYSDDEWATGVAGLQERGVLDAKGELTAAGQRLRGSIELETDKLGAAPWQHLGAERTEEVIALGSEISAVVRAAGGLPTTGIYAAG